MVESLETRSAPALAAINAFVRGSSARLCSSNKLGWDGVYLEHHRAFPVERNDSVSPHHLVVLFTSVRSPLRSACVGTRNCSATEVGARPIKKLASGG